MKPINQTKNFSVCLHGYTLPKHCLYGNVYGIEWHCADFEVWHHKNNDKPLYKIYVWNNQVQEWQKTTTLQYGGIYVRIRDFVKSADFINEDVEYCEHWMKRAERAERVHKRTVIREARKKYKQYKEDMADAPRMKKAQSAYIFKSRPLAGSDKYEYTSGLDVSKYVGFDGINVREKSGYLQPFEQGQNTCGEYSAKCPYTRSGYEVKRDGMKTCRSDKMRPETTKYDNVVSVRNNNYETPCEKTAKIVNKRLKNNLWASGEEYSLADKEYIKQEGKNDN